MEHALISHRQDHQLIGKIARSAPSISLQQARHAAMMKLLQILRKEFSELKHSDDFLLSTIAAVGLASRGLVPAPLRESAIAGFIREYGAAIGSKSETLDNTPFAESCLEPFISCQSAKFESFVETGRNKLVKLVSTFHESAALSESLASGWFKQCSIKTIRTNKNHVDGHRTRAGLEDINQLTQWFTPGWIAQFLVDESIDNRHDAVFLDPACGAGHLLVPALRKLVKEQKRLAVGDAIGSIIERQLFGLDVDKQLVGLAKFALYLETRDLAGIIDLPALNIYSFEGCEENRAIGSLALASGFARASMPKQFDAIAMNPPYLGHRTMPKAIRDFLKTEFPDSQYDLYAAFLELGLRLLKPDGRISAICQQSVLTIQRYESLRETMIRTADIESIAQLGSGSFATKGGEKTNTAMITLRKHGAGQAKDVRCWQLFTKEDKLIAESAGMRQLPSTNVSRADASNLVKVLPQSPFSFWAPQEILRLFSAYPPIIDAAHGIVCTNGLFTCNNKKFVERFDNIAPENQHEYVPYDKGGGHKWYRTSPLKLLWKADGHEIREYRIKRGQSARFPGENYYFTNGVTYSYIGTRGFKARLLTPNSVFDIASSAVFSERIDTMFILGFLNSSLVRSILGVLNPTVNFQIGDIRRLPFKTPTGQIEHSISVLVTRAVDIAREVETFAPHSPRFLGKAALRYDADQTKSLILHEKQCEAWATEELSIQKELDEIIFELYEISSSCRKKIIEDPWVARGADAFRKTAFSAV